MNFDIITSYPLKFILAVTWLWWYVVDVDREQFGPGLNSKLIAQKSTAADGQLT